MAEYISRDLAIEKTDYLVLETCYDCEKVEVMLRDIPTADVIERSTMEILCNEYLSKCNCCDECCAEYFCIENQLRTEKRDCVNNLEMYFTKRNIGE